MCDNTCEVLPTREAHPGLGIQGFYWESVTQAWSTHVNDLSYSDASPMGQKQAFTMSHIVRMNLCGHTVQHGPRLQAYKNILTGQNIPRPQRLFPRSQPRANPKDRSFLGVMYRQPKGTELTLSHMTSRGCPPLHSIICHYLSGKSAQSALFNSIIQSDLPVNPSPFSITSRLGYCKLASSPLCFSSNSPCCFHLEIKIATNPATEVCTIQAFVINAIIEECSWRCDKERGGTVCLCHVPA